jgi:hypothetical protein
MRTPTRGQITCQCHRSARAWSAPGAESSVPMPGRTGGSGSPAPKRCPHPAKGDIRALESGGGFCDESRYRHHRRGRTTRGRRVPGLAAASAELGDEPWITTRTTFSAQGFFPASSGVDQGLTIPSANQWLAGVLWIRSTGRVQGTGGSGASVPLISKLPSGDSVTPAVVLEL